jgi:hypothetical protein
MPEPAKQIGFFKVMVVLLLGGIFVGSVISMFSFEQIGNESGGQDQGPPIMVFIFLSAVLGCAVNESAREHPSLERASKFDMVVFLSWKLLVAIVFTIFLYLAFMSEIISGQLFPRFQSMDATYKDTLTFMMNCKPATNADAAQMLVWAFIAGYSERFVPNLMEKMGNKNTQE